MLCCRYGSRHGSLVYASIYRAGHFWNSLAEVHSHTSNFLHNCFLGIFNKEIKKILVCFLIQSDCVCMRIMFYNSLMVVSVDDSYNCSCCKNSTASQENWSWEVTGNCRFHRGMHWTEIDCLLGISVKGEKGRYAFPKLSKLSSSYIVLCAPPILFLPFSHAIKKIDNWMKKNVTVEYVFIMAMRTNINDSILNHVNHQYSSRNVQKTGASNGVFHNHRHI